MTKPITNLYRSSDPELIEVWSKADLERWAVVLLFSLIASVGLNVYLGTKMIEAQGRNIEVKAGHE